MKVYRLYLAKPLLALYLIVFGMLTVVPLILIVVGFIGMLGPEGPPVWLFVIVLCFGSFLSYMWLRFPFEIRIRDDKKIAFRSLFATTVISAVEIVSVRAKPYALGFVDVVHRHRTVHLLNQMDSFHDFIATIKSMNSATDVKGC